MKVKIPKWKVRFIGHLWHLLYSDIYPSGPTLSQILHESKRGLNGRECELRTRLFKALGIKKAPNYALLARNRARAAAARQKARGSAAPTVAA